MSTANWPKTNDSEHETGAKGIGLKYVWQHANCSTSVFCIVADNRYRIPLPKRNSECIVIRYYSDGVVVCALCFRSHQIQWEEHALLWLRVESAANRFACFVLCSFFRVPHTFEAIVGQFPNKMHFISDILSKCYNNNFYNDILVRCIH